MTFDKLIITLTGLLVILFIYWFFFGKKERQVQAKGSIDITVEGGYKPSYIIVKQETTTLLRFTRKDENSCLEEVVIPEFKIKKYLPLNETVSISITPKKKGEFTFSCSMNMYFGKISVI